MRELITVSLGQLSNSTAAHFWNFQDEWLKQEPVTGEASKDRNPVLFYETHKTGQWVPRTIFVDFQANFGNYLSSFSHPIPKKPEDPSHQTYWHQGKLKVTEHETYEKSGFQRELDIYEEEEEEYVENAD